MKKLITIILLSILLMTEIVVAQSHLWGTCRSGGSNNMGTIFSADGNGYNFLNQYSMNSSIRVPVGSCLYANNGHFYGVNIFGGCSDEGFCYDYDPVTGTFIDFHDLFCDAVHGWY